MWPASSWTSIPQIALRSSGTAAARSIAGIVVAHAVAKTIALSERELFKRWCMIEVVLGGTHNSIVAETFRDGEGFEIGAIVARQAIDGKTLRERCLGIGFRAAASRPTSKSRVVME